MKKHVMVWLSVLLVMGVLAACGESSIKKVEGEDVKVEETASDADQTAEGAGEKAQEPKEQGGEAEAPEKTKTEEFKVGDTVDFNGLHITLTNVRESKGGEFDQVQNDKFILVELNIENKKDEAAVISTMMNMKLMDAEGYEQDQALLTEDVKGNLDAEISPGKKLKGEIPFDVVDSDYYEFIFEDPFASGQAIWKIEPSDIK